MKTRRSSGSIRDWEERRAQCVVAFLSELFRTSDYRGSPHGIGAKSSWPRPRTRLNHLEEEVGHGELARSRSLGGYPGFFSVERDAMNELFRCIILHCSDHLLPFFRFIPCVSMELTAPETLAKAIPFLVRLGFWSGATARRQGCGYGC